MQVPIAPAHDDQIEEAEESLPAEAVAAWKLHLSDKPSTPTSTYLHAHPPDRTNQTDNAFVAAAVSVSSGAAAAHAGHGNASAYTIAGNPIVDPRFRFRTWSVRIAAGPAPRQPGSTTATPSPAAKSGHLVLYRLSGKPYFAASEAQDDSTEPGRLSVSEGGHHAAAEVDACPADTSSEDLQPVDGHVVDMRPTQKSSLLGDELDAGLSHTTGSTGSMHLQNEPNREETESLTGDSTQVSSSGVEGRDSISCAGQVTSSPGQGGGAEYVTPQHAELQQAAAPLFPAVPAVSRTGDYRKGIPVDAFDQTAGGLVLCCRHSPHERFRVLTYIMPFALILI